MFDTQPSLFDPLTYLRKKPLVTGSPPEQALPQPQPPVRVPYRPLEQASPRPRILSPLAHPSQRLPIAAPAAAPSASPAPQVYSPPPTAPALSQPPEQPPQPRPTAPPAPQSQPAPAASVPQPVKQPGPQVPAQKSAQSQQVPVPPPATPTPAPQRQSNTIPQDVLPLPATNAHAATDQPTAQAQAGAAASLAGRQAHESKPDAPSPQAADAAAAARLESSLSTTPGYAQAIPALKALDQEAKSRLAELQSRHPQGPPPEAVQALHADLAQRSSTILAQSQQKLAAAQSAYAGLKAAMNTQAEVAVRPTIAKNLAEALRIPTEEADSLIEDMRNLDWNEHIAQDHKLKTPEDYAREHEKIQESKSISGFIHALGAGARELWNGTQDKRQTRTLTNGAIIVNPAITGEKEYQDAIAASTASPEAKAAALQRYPEIRRAAGQSVLDNIQEIADTFGKEHIQDWKDFASQRPPDVPEQEWAMRFAEKLKTDADASPFATKLKEISRSLAQGTNEAGQQAAGFIGGLTGSQSAMDLATKLSRRSQAYEITKHLDATESHGMLSRAVFSQLPRLLPSLIPASRAARLVQGGTRMFAATRVGQRLLPALGATIQGAATPAQAVKAIETLTRAGLAGSAAMGGAQTYGSQITDIYNTLRSEHPELSHEQALHAAQAPAIVSGLATAALTTLGGTQGVQRLLTRPAEAKAAITQVFTSRMQQLGHLGGDFTKGALKENIEETADGLVSAIAKAVGTGHSVQQAVGDYIRQIPENAIVTSLVGGGGEAIPAAGASTVRRPPGQTAATPPGLPPAPQQHSPAAEATPDSQQPIPDATTPNTNGSTQQPSATASDHQPSQPLPSGSGQQQSPTASNSQPSSTPAAALPVPTFEEAGAAKQTIDKLKAQKDPLSVEQQKELDGAERAFARRTEYNILNQQAGIEKRGGKLHPTTAKALQEAQATLARLKPAAPDADTPPRDSGDTPPPATRAAESDSSQPSPAPIPQTTTQKADHGKAADSDQPPQTSPDSRPTPPQSVEQPPSPRENSGKQPPEAPQNSGKQDDTSGDTPWRTRIPDTTTQHDSDSASPKAAAADPEASSAPPDSSRQNGTPPGATSPGQPSQTSPTAPRGPGEAASPGQSASPSRSSLPPPRTPPQSVEQSRKLIENVSRLHPQAQLHPQVQADLAQARDVVDGHMQKLKGQSSARSDVRSDSRQSNASPAHAPATAKNMPREGSQTGGKAVEQSHTPHQGQPPVAPKVPLSSSAPKLTPQQQAKIPHITQTAKTLLAKLTAAHASQFQNLKTPVVESADANPRTQSGMWLNADYSIGYHLPTLATELATHADHAIPGRIESGFTNLLQASPAYDQPSSTSQANKSISQSGTQPGVDAPNTYTKVESGITPHLKEWTRIDGEIQQWKNDLTRVSESNDLLAMDRIQSKLDVLEEQRQNLIDQAHQFITVPTGIRIPFPFTDLSPSSRPAAIRGAALAERYIHPDLLPSMGTVDFNSDRAGQFRGMLLINRSSSPSKVLHEIAHGVEEQSQNILNKCLAFLQSRAGNEKPQKLSLLMQDKGYKPGEIAYEDEFASRGGSHYMGKVYPDGTEILTMGIERLHADPIEFYMNDPEYFKFVIQTLQHP